MVFLTPKIVRNHRELADVSEAATLKLRNARKNRFRVDVSKEYKMPELMGADEMDAPAEAAPLERLPRD